jgi:hypothetical protein
MHGDGTPSLRVDYATRHLGDAVLMRRLKTLVGRDRRVTAWMLAPELDDDNCERLLTAAIHKSKREVEQLVADLDPKPAVAASMRKLPSARPAAAASSRPQLDLTAPEPTATPKPAPDASPPPQAARPASRPQLSPPARIIHESARPRTTARPRSAFASVANTSSIGSFAESPAKPIVCTIIARLHE